MCVHINLKQKKIVHNDMFEEIGCSRKVSGEFEFELFSYSSGALVRSPFILSSPLMTSSCNVAELAVS